MIIPFIKFDPLLPSCLDRGHLRDCHKGQDGPKRVDREGKRDGEQEGVSTRALKLRSSIVYAQFTLTRM